MQRSRRSHEVRSLGALAPTGRAVVRELLVRGPQPRATLARRLGLSPAHLTKTTRELLDDGVVVETMAVEGGSGEGRGRPGVPLTVVADRFQLIGVKVTEDAVFAVRTDLLGTLLDAEQRDLSATTPAAVVDHIVQVVNELARVAPVQAVGIGLAGAMSRFDDHVRRSLYLGWDEVPLAALVQEGIALPTVVSNDVRALTAGVLWWGPGRGLEDLAVVTTGVGVGLGLVLDGRMRAGTGGTAGMVGHQLIDSGGPLCQEGHRGCASAYLTTQALVGAVAAAHRRPELDLMQVCALADGGDPAALRAIDDAGVALGTIIASLVNLLDLPSVIVTGDGLPAMTRAWSRVEQVVADELAPDVAAPDLQRYDSDFDAWARGAAVVACQWLLLEPPEPDEDSGTAASAIA